MIRLKGWFWGSNVLLGVWGLRQKVCFKQSGTVIKFDNLDQNKLLANQTPRVSSRDTLSTQPSPFQYGGYLCAKTSQRSAWLKIQHLISLFCTVKHKLGFEQG